MKEEIKIMTPSSGLKKAFLDVTVSVCPHCGAAYADASWYVIELGSDVECGVCGRTWNPERHKTDRILVEFVLGDDGSIVAVKKTMRLE
jgi:NMD protein affecting ribosome stability and mRNA decay